MTTTDKPSNLRLLRTERPDPPVRLEAIFTPNLRLLNRASKAALLQTLITEMRRDADERADALQITGDNFCEMRTEDEAAKAAKGKPNVFMELPSVRQALADAG
jgi:hypothetical protein